MSGGGNGRGGTILAGVMGWPVSHSRSPRLHGFWLAEHRIDGAYVPLAVAPDRFEQGLRALPALGFAGANVTLPHKESAWRLVDVRDAAAERIGAVNTIVVLPDGRLEGRNTDAYGFLANLRAGAPGWRGDRPAVVLGAGGAARAVLFALLEAGVPEIRLVNRSREKAETLAAHFGPRIVPADGPDFDAAGLLVNTTSLGMAGQPPLALSLDGMPPDAIVNDLVYAPLLTPLLIDARARGLVAVDGLGMLLHQAAPGFAAWFGIVPEVTEALRAAVLAS